MQRMTQCVLFCLCSLLLGASVTMAGSNCNYYASPNGSGNGLSPSQPFTISAFWGVASPGKTLCLLDGVYTGGSSMLKPPGGLSGNASSPITIRALNDGKALIHGQYGRIPVRLYKNDYFVLEGFNACCSSANVVDINGQSGAANGSDYTIVRRVAAWDCPVGKNCKIFQVSSSNGVLLEDVAGFGTARKIFEVYRSNRVTIRRSWGRWEGSTNSGPKLTFACHYRSYESICENLIGTWSGERQPSNTSPNNRSGIISTDRLEANDDPWANTPRHYNAYMKILGSIAYIQDSDKHVPAELVKVASQNEVSVKDTVAYANPDRNGHYTKPFVLAASTHAPVRGLVATAITSVGGTNDLVSSDWSVAGHSQDDVRASVFSDTSGAQLCYQYRNGARTNTPLWPWPMNARIADALRQAGRAPVDVTQTISRLLGSIPSRCLR